MKIAVGRLARIAVAVTLVGSPALSVAQTQLFMQNGPANAALGTYRVMGTTRVTGLQTVTMTANSNDQQWEIAPNTLAWISPPVLDPATVTSVVCNGWGLESATQANASLRCTVQAYTGAEQTAFFNSASPTEFTTAAAVRNFGGPLVSAPLARGDRLVVKWWFTAAGGTMGNGQTLTGTFAGAAAANGDTWVRIAETLSFGNVLYVGDGTNPPGGALDPGAAATVLDAFTLAVNPESSNVQVNSVTVSLGAGAAPGISLVEITNGAGTVVHGSVVNPASDTPTIALTSNITVTPTAADYAVRITPKTHASMPAVPGGAYTVSGRVTAVTTTTAIAQAFANATTTTFTIDNASPSGPTFGTGAAGNGLVSLTWSNPSDADLRQVIVVRSTVSSFPNVPTEGQSYAVSDTIGAGLPVVCSVDPATPGATGSCDAPGSNGTQYWFALFARDGKGNWSQAPASPSGPFQPFAAVAPTSNSVTPGAVFARAESCNRVTVQAWYSGDANRDATVSFGRGTSASGPFASIIGCQNLGGVGAPRICSEFGGVTPGQTYFYRATFTDPDNAPAPAPAVSSGLTIPPCGATLTLSDPGSQPPASNVTVATVNNYAGRLRIAAAGGAVEVGSLKIANAASAATAAQPGTDVLSIQVWEDLGALGFEGGTTDALLATGGWDPASQKYLVQFQRPRVQLLAGGAKNLLVTLNVAPGARVGKVFQASVSSNDIGLVTAGASVVLGTTVATAGEKTIVAPAAAGSADPAAPMVSILNPGAGASVSGTYRVQAQAYDKAGLANVTVALSTDGGATFPTALAVNAKYSVGTNAAVYEGQVLTPTPGSYKLVARVSNSATGKQVLSNPVLVTVNQAGVGDGNLLRRDNAPQLCADCHAMGTHSSQAAASPSTGDSTYGSWSTTCRDCHTPHGTTNIYLVRNEIVPPFVGTTTYQPARRVYFSDKSTFYAPVTPSTNPSQIPQAGRANADYTGVCQVCHTRTKDQAGNPLWRNDSGIQPAHGGGSPCASCHQHGGGFVASCTSCHGDAGRAAFAEAPPKDTCGNIVRQEGSVVNRVGAHQRHLVGQLTGGVACSECHTNPPARAGHPGPLCSSVEAERAVMTWGPIARRAVDGWSGAPVSPSWIPASQTCQSTYCHGNFTNGANASVTWNSTVSCGSCHGLPPGGTHPVTALQCSSCHGTGYETSGISGAALATHVDGRRDGGGGACDSCHGSSTRAAVAGLGLTDAYVRPMPPKDASSNTLTTFRGVGAHESHANNPAGTASLARPVSCETCHGTLPTDLTHMNGSTPIQVSAGWNGVSCTTFCHGSATMGGSTPTPTWTLVDGSQKQCTSCHSLPPPTGSSGHPPNATCQRCHTGYTSSTIAWSTHVDGSPTVDTSTGCARCHGSLQNGIAAGDPNTAPGLPGTFDAHGNASTVTAATGVGAHRAHLAPAMSSSFGCVQCHPSPDYSDVAHANGTAAVPFPAGLLARTQLAGDPTVPAPSYGSNTCASTYCHGQFQGGRGPSAAPAWSAASLTAMTCTSCHGSPPVPAAAAGGVPASFHPDNSNCNACHVGYAQASVAAVKATHVDGLVQRTATTGCAQCHGVISDGVATTGVNAAPGVTGAVDSKGNAANLTANAGVGAHKAHLQPRWVNAFACTECHPGYAAGDKAHANGSPAVVFSPTSIATTQISGDTIRPAPAYATNQCSNTLCHGRFTGGTSASPVWAQAGFVGTSMTCTSCHGNPPLTALGGRAHPNNTNCGATSCHGAGYSDTNVTGVALGTHVNGVVNYAAQTCTSCHGSTTLHPSVAGADPLQTAAPPLDANGAATGSNVGAHLAHVNRNTNNTPVRCDECHRDQIPQTMLHADGTTLIDATTFGTTARFGGLSPTYAGAGGACASTYCHGNFEGGQNASPLWTGTSIDCTSCHLNPPVPAAAAGGVPVSYHPNNTACNLCHTGYTRTGATTGTTTPATHINRAVERTATTGCAQCHGKLGTAAVAATSVDAAPGIAAGYYDSKGNPDTANRTAAGVGAHRAHLVAGGLKQDALPCAQCHTTYSDRTHANNALDPWAWGTLATAGGRLAANITYSGGTCGNTYCHRGPTTWSASYLGSVAAPSWLGGPGQTVCGSCHAIPPGSHSIGTQSCSNCHPGGYSCSTANLAACTVGASNPNHINGKPEGGESDGTGACGSCHSYFASMNAGSLHRHKMNADTATAKGAYLTTTGQATCTQCHVNHDVFRQDLNSNGRRAYNLRSSVTDQVPNVASPTTGFSNTDHNSTTGTGICVSCHAASLTKATGLPDAGATTPAISGAAYSASAHDFAQFNPTSSFSDFAPVPVGSTIFVANCSKCHGSEPATASKQDSTNKFELHTSTVTSLTDPLGAATVSAMEERFCYRCHSRAAGDPAGNTPVKPVANKDWWGKQDMSAKSQLLFNSFTAATYVSKHPVASTTGLHKPNADDVSGANRHVTCADCHNPHEASAAGDSGTATGATATSLTDSTRSGKWKAGQWTGYKVMIASGAGAGQIQNITGNTAAGVLSVAAWNAAAGTPNTTSAYVITRQGDNAVSGATKGVDGVTVVPGTVYHLGAATFRDASNLVFLGAGGGVVTTASTGTTVTATTALWTANQWATYTMRVVTGTNAGQERTISGNAASTLSIASAVTLAVGDTFVIVKSGAANNPSLTPASLVGGYIRNELDRNGRWYRITAAAAAGANGAYQLTITPNYTSIGAGALSNTKMTSTAGTPWYMDYGTNYSVNFGTTFTPTASAAKEYEICLRCHSSNAFGDSPPNVPSAHQDGTAVAETNVALDFGTGQLSYHPVFTPGLNQPTGVTYAGWNLNAAYTRVDNTGNSATFGLSNTFTTGWFKESLVQCSDCHAGDSGSDPLGPHASGKKWILKGLDTSVAWVRRNSTGTGWETISNADVPSTPATEAKNFCLNCHRWDVYGYINATGTEAGVLSRVAHDPTGHSATFGAGDLPRSGIVCNQCHGGDRIGGAHGSSRRRYPYRFDPSTSNAASFTAGPGSYSGKRLLNGAYWFGVTRATTTTPVACWGKSGTDTVSSCARTHNGTTGNTANYSYDDAADP